MLLWLGTSIFTFSFSPPGVNCNYALHSNKSINLHVPGENIKVALVCRREKGLPNLPDG